MTLFSLLPKFRKAFLELERRKDPTPLGHKILFSRKMDNENFVFQAIAVAKEKRPVVRSDPYAADRILLAPILFLCCFNCKQGDKMESSPGFSIPSIGTPLYQPEEDQQFLMSNSPVPTTQQQQNAFVPPHQQISTGSQNVYSLQGFTPQHMLQPPSTSVINFTLRVDHLTY